MVLDAFCAPWTDRVKTLVMDGPPAESIEEVVRRKSADLVVVATSGASDDSMILLGTVPENVFGTIPCDVAVAQVESTFRRP